MQILCCNTNKVCCRDSPVGITTRYGLDGPGIESRWGGARFSAPVQTGPGAYPASCTMGTRSFPGVKRPGRGADHPHTSKSRGLKLGGAIPLPALRALVACYRENLYFTIKDCERHCVDRTKSILEVPNQLLCATPSHCEQHV